MPITTQIALLTVQTGRFNSFLKRFEQQALLCQRRCCISPTLNCSGSRSSILVVVTILLLEVLEVAKRHAEDDAAMDASAYL